MFGPLWEAFSRWGHDRGSNEVISEVYPVVSGGVAAAAFHGLIRLAYGIEADHVGEIAAGLATICSRYADPGAPHNPPTAASVDEAFARIAAGLSGSASTGPGIIGKMRAATADSQFAAAFSLPPIGPALLHDLARVAIALYWQTSNFTVLHMVTATHAARVLFDRYPQLALDQAITFLWEAAGAAYVGAPPLFEVRFLRLSPRRGRISLPGPCPAMTTM
jgi:hypothetical protein